METILNYLKDHLIVSVAIGVLLVVVVHSMIAVFLNKLHEAKYSRTTGIAWFPILNIYLLGKLAVHAIVGFLVIVGLIFGIIISFNIKGLESIHNIMPSGFVLPYQIGYGVIILVLYIVAKIKLYHIHMKNLGKDDEHSFVNKDFDKKEPEVVANNNTKGDNNGINDNYKYNQTTLYNSHTSLNNLSNQLKNNDNNKSNPE